MTYELATMSYFAMSSLARSPGISYTALVPDKNSIPGSDVVALQEQLLEICDRNGLDLVYSFGSRGRELKDYLNGFAALDKNNLSDVDIGVRLSTTRATMSVREKVQVAAEMEELLGVERVDLVILQEADPFLSANIVRGERIFSRDPYMADEYELYILRRAGDLAPLEHERLSMVFTKAGRY